MSLGLASTRSVSGWLGFCTPSSHAPRPRATVAAAVRIRCRIMSDWLLEARGDGEREGPERREAERIDLVDETGAALVGAAGCSGFRIEAGVVGDGPQVPADDTEREVTDSADVAELVRHAELAELDERPILHDVVVRAEHVVEPARAGALARTRTPLVAHRLRGLDRTIRLIEVRGTEIEEPPALALVIDVVAHRALEQAVDAELLVVDGVAVPEPEIGEGVADDLLDAEAFSGLTAKRPIDDRVAEVQRHLVAPWRLRARELGLPEI